MANTDFIEKIINKESFQEVEQMNQLLDVLLDKFVKVADAAGAADKAIGSSKGLKDYTEETEKLSREQQELLKLQKQIETTVAKRTAAESKLAQELAKEKVLLQQVNKDNTNAAKINLTNAGSLARFEAVVARLRAKQRDLNLTTEEGQKKSELYKKAIDNITNAIKKNSDAQKQQSLNVGNYQGSAQIIVEALERARQKAEQFTKQFGQTSPEARSATRAMEGLQRIVEQPQFLNISNKFTGTNKELRFFQQQISQLKASGAGADVIAPLTKRLAELTDELGDTRAEIKALSSDTRSFDLFAGSVTFAADAMQTFAGVVQLAGVSQEETAKITADLIAVQAVANGVKGIANELTTKGTAANKVYAFTQGLVTTALDRSAAASRRFYAALGLIGLVVTVIGAVAIAMGELNRKLTDAEQKQKALNDVIKEAAADYGKAKVEVAQMGKEIELAKKGVLDKEVVLKKFNETIGETIGQTKSLEEAEATLSSKKDAYVQMMFAKSQAAAAFALANKAAEESVKNELATTDELLTTFEEILITFKSGDFGAILGGVRSPEAVAKAAIESVQEAEKKRSENRNKLQNDYNNFLNIGNQKLEEAGTIAEQNKFTTKEQLELEKEKKKKAEEEAKRRAQLAKEAAEKQKKIDKEIADFQKKLTQENDKSKTEFLNNQEQRVIDNFKRIADNEKLSLNERLTANTAFYSTQEQLIREKAQQEQQALINEATAEAERILGRKLNAERDADLILKINQSTANKRALIQQKSEDEIVAIRQEGVNRQNEIVNGEAGRQLSIIQKQGEDRLRQIEINELNEITALEKSFERGQITKEQYELKKLEIQNRYINERLSAELAFAEEMVAISKALGTDTTEIEKRIADIKLQQAKIVTQGLQEENRKQIELEQQKNDKIRELYNELKQVVFTFLDAGFERQKNAVQREKNLIEERKAAELDRINRLQIAETEKAALTQRLDVQTENQKRILDLRQKQIEIRRAKFNRGVQAAFTTGETIKDVASLLGDAAKAKAQAAVLASNPLTAAFAPAALVNAGLITGLAILQGAVGAARVAQILGTPIPEYWTGTEDSKGGLAWLGERGKELLITPDNKVYETPGSATLAVIPEHSKVINNPDYMNMLKNDSVNSTLKTKPLSQSDFIQWQLKQAELNTDAIVSAIKNKPEAIFNVDPYGAQLWKKHAGSWFTYLDKKVRFKK